jgi:hypothetical protein
MAAPGRIPGVLAIDAFPAAAEAGKKQMLYGKQNLCYIFLTHGIEPSHSCSRPRSEKNRTGELDLRRFAHNLRRELSRIGFFNFFGCNPLKSLDSTKENQINPSNSACFYLDLFGGNSPAG